MIETLNKYLIQHKSINIPGLGTIFIEHRPAIFDVVNKRILPPHYEYRFNKYFDTPDKEFFSYLSYERGIPDYEAIQQYNQFAQDFRTAIRQDDKASWQDVGVFTKNNSGDIIFESDNGLSSLYMPVAAVKVVREQVVPAEVDEKTIIETTESLNDEMVDQPDVLKQTWWIYALVVLVVALLFAGYHFYKNGFNVTALGNGSAVNL